MNEVVENIFNNIEASNTHDIVLIMSVATTASTRDYPTRRRPLMEEKYVMHLGHPS